MEEDDEYVLIMQESIPQYRLLKQQLPDIIDRELKEADGYDCNIFVELKRDSSLANRLLKAGIKLCHSGEFVAQTTAMH